MVEFTVPESKKLQCPKTPTAALSGSSVSPGFHSTLANTHILAIAEVTGWAACEPLISFSLRGMSRTDQAVGTWEVEVEGNGSGQGVS